MPLQIRRGTEAERQTLASPLVAGELLWITDDEKLYIGNGTTLAKDLAPVTGFGTQEARDTAASIFTAGTHSGISFSYDGSTAIDATVSYPALLQNLNMNNFDITGNGNITISGTVTADAFRGDYKGSISADDSTILVDAVNGSINLDGTVKSNVIPSANDLYDLGSNSNRFKDLYISGTIIANALVADYTGSVFADNSTVLVDAINASINLDGTVKGDIIPSASEIYDLGSNSNRFKDLYLSGSSIYLGDAVIESTGTGGVNLPAGSEINGISIEELVRETGVTDGSNYNINIVGDDSSFLVNSFTKVISGNELIAVNLTTQTISTEDSSEVEFLSPVRFLTTVTSDQELITESLQVRVIESRDAGPIEINSSNTLNLDADTLILDADTISLRAGVGQVNIGSATANQDGNLYIVRNNYESTLLKGFTFAQHHETADSVKFNFFRSRGTATSPTPVQTGDDIVDINFVGIGTSFTNPTASTIAARISVVVEGTVSGRVPGKIQFFTNNEVNFAPRAELSKDGIWRTNAISSFDSGIVLFETMPQLPEYADETAAGPGRGVAPQNGMMYYDTGAAKVKVYANGAWHAITP